MRAGVRSWKKDVKIEGQPCYYRSHAEPPQRASPGLGGRPHGRNMTRPRRNGRFECSDISNTTIHPPRAVLAAAFNVKPLAASECLSRHSAGGPNLGRWLFKLNANLSHLSVKRGDTG